MIRVPIGQKLDWQVAARKRGVSVTTLICEAMSALIGGDLKPTPAKRAETPKPQKAESPKERKAVLAQPAPPPVPVIRQKAHHIRCDCPVCRG